MWEPGGERSAATPLQAGLLLVSRNSPGSGAYLQQVVCDIKGSVDAGRLRACWLRLHARHPALRVRFSLDPNRGWILNVAKAGVAPLFSEDWADRAPKQAARACRRFLDRDRALGFALDGEIPSRAVLIRLGERRHRLVWTFHHALLDGRSHTALLQELLGLYDGGPRSDALPVPDRLFLAHLEWLNQRDARHAGAYWKSALTFQQPPSLDFAGRAPARGLAVTGKAREFRLGLSRAETETLYRFCEQIDVSLNVAALAAWALVVASYTDKDDVVVGTVRSCRRSLPKRFDRLQGLLINTLPMRFRVPSDRNVQDWLQTVDKQWREAAEHQLTPIQAIRAFSDWPSSKPLFSTIHVHEHRAMEEEIIGGAESAGARRAWLINGRTEAPVSIATYGGARFHGCVSVERPLLESVDGREICYRYLGFLRQFVIDPTCPVADLERLTMRERARVHVAAEKHASGDIPSIAEQFVRQAHASASHAAVVDGGESFSYERLLAESEDLRNLIRQTGRAGVAAVMAERGSRFIVAMFAAVCDERAFLPLDPSYPENRLAFMLADCDCRLAIADRRHLDLARRLFAAAGISGSIIVMDESRTVETGTSGRTIDSATRAPAAVYVVYTSGTTGKPKGVPITSANLMPLMCWQQGEFGLGSTTRTAQTLPVSFDFGLQEIFTTLLFGGSLFVTSAELVADPERYVDFLRERAITMVYATPSFMRMLVAQGRPLPSLRVVLLGGEALDRRLTEDLERLVNEDCRVYNGYGPTEATMNCAMYRATAAVSESSSVPIGFPSGLSRLYVVGGAGHLVPDGVPGELLVGGPGVASGYLNRDALTDERFLSDRFDPSSPYRLYRTGDRVRRLPDGSLEFLGRMDNQVKVRGHRIELEEVDNALASHRAVRAAASTTVERQRGVTELAAFIVAGDPNLTERDLRRFLRGSLPGPMVPTYLRFVDQLPLTSNGKVDRARLLHDESVSTLPTPETSKEEGLRDRFHHWFYRPVWRLAGRPADRDRGPRRSVGAALVFSDGGPLARSVANALDARGIAHEVVYQATGGHEAVGSGHRVDSLSPFQLESLLRTLRDRDRLPESIFYLWPLAESDSVESSSFDQPFQRLLCLLQAIAGVYNNRSLSLGVITANAQAVIGGDLRRPRLSLLQGLCRAAAVELSHARIVNIDIDAGEILAAERGGAIVEDLTVSPPGAVVAYRRDQRFRWELERISALERGLPRLRAGGSYAVTGGLGGVGIELATVLARNGAGHIALIDAEDLSEPPDGGNRERRSRAERALEELRARGVEITMLRANVADQDELAAGLATFRERRGGINGVIHAAGRVHQSVLRKLTFADARCVMAPKVLGAEVLAKTLAGDPLDFVAYCSSIDAIRGSFGQAAYCAANAFLDAHAQSLSDAGRPFVSVNWDVWQQVGMAAEATVPQALRRARAVELSMGILPMEGRQAFVRVLGLGEPQVLVSTTDPAPRIGRLGVTLDSAQAMSGDGDPGRTVPRAPAGSRRQGDLVARISGMFGSTLDIEPPEPDADFFELGGDSLSAMRLVIRLREAVGVDLPFARLFDYPSAIELARFIEDELPRDI